MQQQRRKYMFCYNLCANNSTNFNSRQSCCGWSRTNYGCGWYCCPNCCNFSTLAANNLPSPIPTVNTNIAYFTNPSATSIATQTAIPVNLSKQIGSAITSSGTGVLLQPGVYKVDYSLTGTSQTTGPSTVGLQLNGTTLPQFSQTQQVSAAGDKYNIAANGLVTVSDDNSILNLENLGANSQDFSNVNLVVQKVS